MLERAEYVYNLLNRPLFHAMECRYRPEKVTRLLHQFQKERFPLLFPKEKHDNNLLDENYPNKARNNTDPYLPWCRLVNGSGQPLECVGPAHVQVGARCFRHCASHPRDPKCACPANTLMGPLIRKYEARVSRQLPTHSPYVRVFADFYNARNDQRGAPSPEEAFYICLTDYNAVTVSVDYKANILALNKEAARGDEVISRPYDYHLDDGPVLDILVDYLVKQQDDMTRSQVLDFIKQFRNEVREGGGMPQTKDVVNRHRGISFEVEDFLDDEMDPIMYPHGVVPLMDESTGAKAPFPKGGVFFNTSTSPSAINIELIEELEEIPEGADKDYLETLWTDLWELRSAQLEKRKASASDSAGMMKKALLLREKQSQEGDDSASSAWHPRLLPDAIGYSDYEEQYKLVLGPIHKPVSALHLLDHRIQLAKSRKKTASQSQSSLYEAGVLTHSSLRNSVGDEFFVTLNDTLYPVGAEMFGYIGQRTVDLCPEDNPVFTNNAWVDGGAVSTPGEGSRHMKQSLSVSRFFYCRARSDL
eukprot:Nk52_evm9s151 gene=Nk52_evmTU9s151